jgi:hypothetical protein
MPRSVTGERVTPVLDFPSRDGRSVQAIRIDDEPGGFTRGTDRHPAGAYVYGNAATCSSCSRTASPSC